MKRPPREKSARNGRGSTQFLFVAAASLLFYSRQVSGSANSSVGGNKKTRCNCHCHSWTSFSFGKPLWALQAIYCHLQVCFSIPILHWWFQKCSENSTLHRRVNLGTLHKYIVYKLALPANLVPTLSFYIRCDGEIKELFDPRLTLGYIEDYFWNVPFGLVLNYTLELEGQDFQSA